MPSTYTPALRLTKPADGELDGTWGQTVNDGITQLVEDSVAGYVSIALPDANYTLSTANGATDEARKMLVNLTGALSAQRNVVCPTANKMYIVRNATTGGFGIVFKTSGGTGITVANGKTAILYCDGTNVLDGLTSYATTPVSAANGGTGQSSYAVGDLLYASGAAALSKLADVATGNALISGGVGVAPAYGKIGLTTHVSGTLSVANGGIGVATLTGIPKGNGASAFSVASAGTDYVAPGVATTFTAKQTFNGATGVAAATFRNALEDITISATATTDTFNFDVTTQAVLYHTSNAAGNFVINVRGNASTTLNTLMATGEACTIVFLCTLGATPRWATNITIDGASEDLKWLNDSAPSTASANSVEAYTITIVKTGASVFTIFAARSTFG